MKSSTKISLLIVFLACSLSQIMLGNASGTPHKLTIYENTSPLGKTPEIVLCDEETKNIPVLLENEEKDHKASKSTKSNEFMLHDRQLIENPNSFYHLAKCVSKLEIT